LAAADAHLSTPLPPPPPPPPRASADDSDSSTDAGTGSYTALDVKLPRRRRRCHVTPAALRSDHHRDDIDDDG